MRVTASNCGHWVNIDDGPCPSLTKQEAYELYVRLGRVLPKLVQPFDPVELEPKRGDENL